jgi:hypothetical protein
MYTLTLTWLLGLLGFLVLAGCAMAIGLWVRERLVRAAGKPEPLGTEICPASAPA